MGLFLNQGYSDSMGNAKTLQGVLVFTVEQQRIRPTLHDTTYWILAKYFSAPLYFILGRCFVVKRLY